MGAPGVGAQEPVDADDPRPRVGRAGWTMRQVSQESELGQASTQGPMASKELSLASQARLRGA